jgi:2,4-dienoyl-CoA reductase-like NADH-dependent reductase (Old Yellow Enzyme family)
MDALADPLTLRSGLEVPQRLALAPLTNKQSHPDGTLSDDEFAWLARRARDGFAWVSTCASYVSPEGKAWDGQLGIATDVHLPGLTRLAEELRRHGSVGIVQLHHGGAKAELAPGRRLSTFDGAPGNSRGASHADIHRVTEDFVRAARRAERAGFSGVEVHGANGYLFTQFLAPEDNPRRDEYGGDLVGRARFLRETIQAVRAEVSPGFTVGVRISPVDVWAQRGLVLADGVQVACWLAEDGADFVHLSLKDAAGPAPHQPEAGVVVREVREAVPPEVAIMAAGGVWTRNDALQVLEAGADLVALGKAAIIHPDWPVVSTDDDWKPIRPTWPREALVAADVGPDFLAYLRKFPGLIEGGAAARS